MKLEPWYDPSRVEYIVPLNCIVKLKSETSVKGNDTSGEPQAVYCTEVYTARKVGCIGTKRDCANISKRKKECRGGNRRRK